VRLVVAVLAAAVLVSAYLSWVARRLDRLHARVEAARAALDAQLVRRAAAAGELAAQAREFGLWSAGTGESLAAAAAAARVAGPEDREVVENDLSRALKVALAGFPALPRADPRVDLGRLLGGGTAYDDSALSGPLAELEAAATRVVLARRFYNDGVRDTRALRSRRIIRWLHLAGHAPPPAYFEIDDTPLPELSPD